MFGTKETGKLARHLMARASVQTIAVALAVATCGMAHARSLPGGGRFVSGQGQFSRTAGRLTVEQASQTGIIDWRSFSIGAGNLVRFDNAGGATLNRVTGGDLSRISGSLHASGSVYLINRAGVAITGTGRIDTQGDFAASGRGMDGGALLDGRRLRLSAAVAGNVINRGTITSANGNVSLHGHRVIDTGRIAARNAQLIASRGERVSGAITVRNKVETSGRSVAFGGAQIQGRSWLVDPQNLTVRWPAASTIQRSLQGGTDVTLDTTGATASGPGARSAGQGDITIAAPIAWSTTATLSLNSNANIFFDSVIDVNGAGAVDVQWNSNQYIRGTDDVYMFRDGGEINFNDVIGGVTQGTFSEEGTSLTLVNSMAQLQAIGNSSSLSTFQGYALANSLDASSVTNWIPIGTDAQGHVLNHGFGFLGLFDGLGHTISNFTLNMPKRDRVGLFGDARGQAGNGAQQIRNVIMVNEIVVGRNAVGGIVGHSGGSGLSGNTVSGSITGHSEVGGIAGAANDYFLAYNTSSATVTGNSLVGGVAGEDAALLLGDTATGVVQGQTAIGGLVGESFATIYQSYSSASVTGTYYVGGLVGEDAGTISNSYASGDVTGVADVGGLAGELVNRIIFASYSTGHVAGKLFAGGLVGRNLLGKTRYSYWDTQTSGQSKSAGGVGMTTAQLEGVLPTGFSNTVWGTASGKLPFLLWQ